MTPDNEEPREDRREGGDRPHYRPRGDRGYRPRDGGRSDGDRRPYRPHDGRRSEGHSSSGDHDGRGYRPRDGGRPYRRDGEDHRSGDHDGRGYSPREGGRPYRRDGEEGRSEGYRPRRNFDDHGFRLTDERRRGGDRGFRGDHRPNGRRDGYRDDRRSYRDEPRERPKLSIPSSVTEILHKGVDCEVNGRSDLAMILYLHGASKLNGGCEKNLLRMLREAGKDQFPTIRGRLRRECPDEIMPVLDYLFSTLDKGYDTSSIRESAASGNVYAIHCLILMDEVEKEDDLIDVFAKSVNDLPELVTDGLDRLARKSCSDKAKGYLAEYHEYLKHRDSIKTMFARSMNGDASARQELDKLAETFPEAGFLRGYVDAVQEGDGDGYLKAGLRNDFAYIMPNLQNCKVQDQTFLKYLKARKLKVKGEEWIPAMIDAVKEGSDEALYELYEVQNRWDVRKSLQSYYFAKGDLENLVRGYDGRDSEYLDKFCNGDSAKVLEVGRLLGGTREIEWLSKCSKTCPECRDALVQIAADRRSWGKPLLYALHDSGADMDAAKLYFDMKDDPSLPSVKWLAKVCRNEEAKEYIRSRFEQMDDLATFDYIFEDDGYVPGYIMKREKAKERHGDRRRY